MNRGICLQGYLDELAWGAAWLYKATNNTQYLTDAQVSAAARPETPLNPEPLVQIKAGASQDIFRTPGTQLGALPIRTNALIYHCEGPLHEVTTT